MLLYRVIWTLPRVDSTPLCRPLCAVMKSVGVRRLVAFWCSQLTLVSTTLAMERFVS
jgi:hypothetical protein